MLERVFGSPSWFDPSREEREFVILASDCTVAVLGDRLAREVSAQAPRVRITFRQVPVTITDDLAAQLGMSQSCWKVTRRSACYGLGHG